MNRLSYEWSKWKAVTLLVIGRRASALTLFNSMLEHWPDDTYLLSSRTNLLAQDGRVDEALVDSTRLTALQPNNPRTWFNHGFVLEAAGRLDDALDAFVRSTELSPKLDRAWYGMGLVLIRLQRYDDAVAALKRNTELQPMSPYGWYQLARVHVDRKDTDAAVKIIRHLRGFEPKVAAQLERETGLLVGKPAS